MVSNLVPDGVQKCAFPFETSCFDEISVDETERFFPSEMEKGATVEGNGAGHKKGNLTY